VLYPDPLLNDERST